MSHADQHYQSMLRMHITIQLAVRYFLSRYMGLQVKTSTL